VHGLGGSDGAGKRGEVLERLVGGRAGQRETGSAEDFPDDVVLGGRGRELTRCWDERHGHDQLAAASDGAKRRRRVQNSRRTHALRSEPGKHAVPARSESPYAASWRGSGATGASARRSGSILASVIRNESGPELSDAEHPS
jgi:hypothetical protein